MPIKDSRPALCRIRHNDFYRSPPVTISVIPVLNAGGFCPIALPNDQPTYAKCCRGVEFGLERMLVNAAAVLLGAACTHLPTGRRRLLPRRGNPTRAGGGSLFYASSAESVGDLARFSEAIG
jgi:hypothetical protein